MTSSSHQYRTTLLGLPDDALPIALIPLGYPNRGRWAEPKRRPLDEVMFEERYRTDEAPPNHPS